MPKNRFSIKYRIWKLVISQPFDWFIMFMIALNTLILMMKVRTATRRSVVEYGPPLYVDYIAVAEWLAVSMLDSGAEGPGFKSQPRLCLRPIVHTHRASVYQAAKLVAALLRIAGITAGLAESNGSLPPGL